MPDFGFRADASDVKRILDIEFEKANVPMGSRKVALAGHSRGWIVSASFKTTYGSEYERVVVASYDGRICDGLPIPSSYEDDLKKTVGFTVPEGTIRYGLAPFMPFIGGIMDMALVLFSGNSFFSGQLESGLYPIPVEPGIIPSGQQKALVNRYTQSRYWERSAYTRVKWENDYVGDGPTLDECIAAKSTLGDHLWLPAFSICADMSYATLQKRALHVSLVQFGPFALTATKKFKCFLNSTLFDGGACDGIIKVIDPAQNQAGTIWMSDPSVCGVVMPDGSVSVP